MTPQQALAALDAQLAAHGENVTLTRGATTATVKAFIRGRKTTEFVGPLTMMEWDVTLSASELSSYGVPKVTNKAGDKLTVKGRECSILMVEPIHMGGTFVRCNLVVSG